MNTRNQMDSHADDHRKEAERARETARQAVSARDRAFWSALAANWEKFASEAEAHGIRRAT